MKTYVITLSKKFPSGHIRAGEPTYFWEKFIKGQGNYSCIYRDFWETTTPKIHTIRANYPLWEQRFAEIERGDACLSVRQWTGKPYRSPQVEIGRLTHADGIGIQKLDDSSPFVYLIDGHEVGMTELELAHNDGLSFADWRDWFKGYDKTQPMVIIHFTKFRY